MLSECNDNLTPPQRLSIELTVAGWRLSDVAAEVKVTLRTIQRWRLLPEYKEALREAHREKHAETDLLVKASIAKAIRKVVQVLDTPNLKTGDYLLAARLIGELSGFMNAAQVIADEQGQTKLDS
jgi:hypothetical protein